MNLFKWDPRSPDGSKQADWAIAVSLLLVNNDSLTKQVLGVSRKLKIPTNVIHSYLSRVSLIREVLKSDPSDLERMLQEFYKGQQKLTRANGITIFMDVYKLTERSMEELLNGRGRGVDAFEHISERITTTGRQAIRDRKSWNTIYFFD
jgi:hypothetical protein